MRGEQREPASAQHAAFAYATLRRWVCSRRIPMGDAEVVQSLFRTPEALIAHSAFLYRDAGSISVSHIAQGHRSRVVLHDMVLEVPVKVAVERPRALFTTHAQGS